MVSTASLQDLSKIEYPNLYDAADEASTRRQKAYLFLVGFEYGLLLLAAILSLNFSNKPAYFAFYAMVFVASLGVLLYRTSKKPEQDWYRCRALAESVKTSTWRYMMRAEPFQNEGPAAREELRKVLSELLKSNEHVTEQLASSPSDRDQTTPQMERVRALRWMERRDLYVLSRIRDQRTWYSTRAGKNAQSAARWRRVAIIIYAVALALVLVRSSFVDWTMWPIAPLIVIASAILGWMQIKKFNELASIYTLTAHEIGLIEGRLREVDTEQEFSRFVNEAELAFSREHTQWIARQTHKF